MFFYLTNIIWCPSYPFILFGTCTDLMYRIWGAACCDGVSLFELNFLGVSLKFIGVVDSFIGVIFSWCLYAPYYILLHGHLIYHLSDIIQCLLFIFYLSFFRGGYIFQGSVGLGKFYHIGAVFYGCWWLFWEGFFVSY